jgi:hypothetical protein
LRGRVNGIPGAGVIEHLPLAYLPILGEPRGQQARRKDDGRQRKTSHWMKGFIVAHRSQDGTTEFWS